MGERIDGDPVRSLARALAEELPASFGIDDDQAFEHPEGEPADLEWFLAEEAIDDVKERVCGLTSGSRAEGTTDRGEERDTHAIGRPEPRRDRVLAVAVLVVTEAHESASKPMC